MRVEQDFIGRRVLVTGANSGVGRGVAEALALRGARVEILCRDRGRGERAQAEIHRACGRQNTWLTICDLGDLDAVRRAVDEILAGGEHLDLLVNNAGLLSRKHRLSPQGHEWTLAVNHLGPFLLTRLLLDAIPDGGRVVNLASIAHTRGRFDFEDMEMRSGYGFWEAYARSKLANVLFTYALARRLEGSGRTANCLHPGVLPTGIANGFSPWATRIWRLISPFYRPVSEGVDAVLRVALDPELEGINGRYFYRGELAESSALSRDEALQERLWEWSERATGVAPAKSPTPDERGRSTQ